MLNYDIVVTKNDKIFLTWHQKNGEGNHDYDIFIKVFKKDLTVIKEMTLLKPNGLEPFENQMYPNLLNLSDGNILLAFQTNYVSSSDGSKFGKN